MFSKALKYELPSRIISAFKSVNHFSLPSLPKIIFSNLFSKNKHRYHHGIDRDLF